MAEFLNPELDYRSLTTALQHCIRQWATANIHTALPGQVESYDANTRRAVIQPLIKLVVQPDDPTQPANSIERSILVNVPVIHPLAGGLYVQLPVKQGDQGMILFSERGLTEFKQSGRMAMPDRTRMFDDAVFLPVDFGHQPVSVVDSDAVVVQSVDGSTSVAVKPGAVTITASNVEINSSTTTINSSGGTAVFT